MFYIFSTFVLCLLGVGIHYRSYRSIHVPLMLSAFLLDLTLVLVIEIQRHAVEKVVQVQVPPLTMVHAGISTVVLLLYAAAMVLGFRLLRGHHHCRPLHRWAGIALLAFRIANYITSFMLPMG